MALLINGMKGLGDNIYQRAFVKNLGKVWLDTPWPELYEGLTNVSFVHSRTTLRTQKKNIARQSSGVFKNFPGGTVKAIRYGNENIIEGMTKAFGVRCSKLDLPDYGMPPVDGEYAVIRPVTLRKEWMAETRNPLPEYMEQAAEELREAGIKVVSVADLQQGEEWIVGNEPYADAKFHKGELGVRQLLSLIKNASLVVGGVGWIVPACIAYQTPAYIVCGGNGGWNHPNHITHQSMNLTNIKFELPDNFCMCATKAHDCDKKITGYRDKFRAYLASRDWGRLSPTGTD